MEVDLLPWKLMELTSMEMEVNLLLWKEHLIPWKLVEASVKVELLP